MKPPAFLALVTTLLLVIVFSRSTLLNQITFDQDEVRSAMRAMGTGEQIVAWQPTDWPPLYNLVLGGWRALVSPHPVMLRISSVLFSVLAAACAYRAAYALLRHRYAALGVMLAYSALGYSIFLSTYLRAYVMAMALFPVALWLTMRYMRRPSWRRALPLGATIAALLYTTYTFVFVVALLGLYTLLITPRAMWRWWKPGVIAVVLSIPEFARKGLFFADRVGDAAAINPTLPALPDAMLEIFGDYAGSAVVAWLVIVVVALVLIVLKQRPLRRETVWFVGAMLLSPLALYVFAAIPIFYYFTARYSWWALFLIALTVGAGIVYLPRVGRWAVMLVMAGLLFAPTIEGSRYLPYPFEPVFSWLGAHTEPGDVLLVDPAFCLRNCPDANSEDNKFAYYLSVFAPDMPLVTSPDGHRRVWYLSQDGWQDDATYATVRDGRAARMFAGPWNFLVRLYESPPDADGVLFANGLRFHGLEVVAGDATLHDPISLMEQDALRVRLWWSADRAPDHEASTALKLVDGDGREIAGVDGPPLLVQLDPTGGDALPADMTQWEPDTLYIDERVVALPALDDTAYATVYLTVYQWWDGARLDAPGANDDGLLPVEDVVIWGF